MLVLRMFNVTLVVKHGILILCASMAYGQDDTISVCTALSKSAVLTSKVAVYGKLIGSSRHGFALSKETKQEPCEGLGGRFMSWPPTIALKLPSEGRAAQLAYDKSRLVLALAQERIDSGNFSPLDVLVTGTLERSRFPIVWRRSDGSYSGFEYGPDGQFPVAIVVHEIVLLSARNDGRREGGGN